MIITFKSWYHKAVHLLNRYSAFALLTESILCCGAEGPPLVIANGGTSGLYPDQTLRAYRDAANSTSSPLALLCDLMISKDNFGICRPGFFLEMSTNTTSYPATAKRSTYSGYGQNLTGYFANDFTLAELLTVTGKAFALKLDFLDSLCW